MPFPTQLRLSARSLARSPGFTLVTVLTLAVGIASVTAILAVLDRVVLRPLPYPDADRLVSIRSAVPGQAPDAVWGLSEAGYFLFAAESRTLEAIGLADDVWVDVNVTLSTGEGAVRVPADSVTATVFDVLGARASHGRLFDEDDDRPGAPPVMVLSHEIWTAHFGADPTVVGRTLQVEGASREVIGVMERGFHLPARRAGVWVPFRLDPAKTPENEHSFGGIARLRPGARIEDAQAELDRLTARFPELLPEAYDAEFMEEWGFATRVESVRDYVLGDVPRVVWTLLAGVGLVLILALANVVNLFLLRTEVRRSELAVRTAHGATRWRLAGAGFGEGLVVSGAAAVLGVVLASLALDAIPHVAPDAIPRVDELGLDWTGLGFALAIALAAAAVTGALPPLLARVDLATLQGGHGTAASGRLMLRRVLVGAQVAIALTLLAGAGLMVRSFDRLHGQEMGFDRENLIAFQLALPVVRYGSPEASARFYRELIERMEALPDIAAAGAVTRLPFRQPDGCWATHSDERPTPEGQPPPCVQVFAATPGYMRTLGMAVQGRIPDWDDAEGGTADIVVTRSIADRFWPDQNPVGKSIRGFSWGEAPRYQVAAVAADVRADGLDQEPEPTVYLPILPLPGTPLHWGPFWGAERELHVVARAAAGSPEALAPAIRTVIEELDPELAPGPFQTMTDLIARSESVARTSLLMLLLGVAAAIALFLSAVGLYGAVSYFVRQRTREIGLRMALGADVRVVATHVLKQAVTIALAGVAVGLTIALAMTRLLRSLLFEIHPNDPITLVAAGAVLVVVSGVAAWIPARRAIRIDPVDALREA